MAGDPRTPGGGPEPPEPPPTHTHRPPEESGDAPAWRAFVLGPHGSPRRTSALRGLAAAIVVLVIGLPLAIALPGSGSPAAAPSPSTQANHTRKHHCAQNSVAGGQKPPAVQPAAVAPDATVFAFGPSPRVHGAAVPDRIEVWLNTDTPDRKGPSLGAGPVEQLASEKVGRDCAFSVSFSAPRVPSGNYEIRLFSFADESKKGWTDLGGRTLTVSRHPNVASKTEAATFAADFLLARLIRAGGAAKAMLSSSADFPKAGQPGALFAKSYRKADVRSVHALRKGTYRIDVRITREQGPPTQQTLEVGSGTNTHGDAVSLVVTRSVFASDTQSQL